MNDLTTVAVAKVIKEATLKASRRELNPGTYRVDETLRIVGSIRVGEDSYRTPTVNIPIIDALCLFAHDAGITGQAACNALQRAMTRSLELDDDAKAIIQGLRENMDEAERKVRSTLAALPKAPVKGQVTTKLEIEALETVGVF